MKQLEDVFTGNVQLETIEKLHESTLKRLEAVLKPNGGKMP